MSRKTKAIELVWLSCPFDMSLGHNVGGIVSQREFPRNSFTNLETTSVPVEAFCADIISVDDSCHWTGARALHVGRSKDLWPVRNELFQELNNAQLSLLYGPSALDSSPNEKPRKPARDKEGEEGTGSPAFSI